ncbi:hypothetical protein D4764_15G0013310 [Takifugu flavidus]|uniref:Uncharacterized protein n=1 Tax=Takifugu flavidus TaxID=433684 RepID=A0A5C6P3P3_9TELE|nr:hypothetical protein D4764_15G0013310 [Takifugu flavidus]
MSEHSDSKPFLFTVLEDEGEASGCRGATSCSALPRGGSGRSAVGPLHHMGGYSQAGPHLGLQSEGSDSSGQDPPCVAPHPPRRSGDEEQRVPVAAEPNRTATRATATTAMQREQRHESVSSSNGNSKDSALLESSGSNKR